MAVSRSTTLSRPLLRQRASGAALADACRWTATLVPYLLIVALPLAFWLGTNNIFDLPKVTVLRLFTILALLAWAARAALIGRLAIRPIPLARPVLAYALVLVLATVFSQAPLISLFGINERQDGLLTQLNYIVLYFLVANTLVSSRQVKLALELHVATAAAVGLMGILQYLGIGTFGLAADYWGYRAFATLGNPDFLGTYLVLALPPAVALALLPAARGRRLLWSAATFLLATALLVTFTRGAWIGALVALLLLSWLLRRSMWAARRWLVVLTIAVALAALATQSLWLEVVRPAGAGPDVLAIQPPSLAEVGATALDVRKGTSGNRLLIWRSTLDLVLDHPVLGVGLNAFMGAFSRYASPEYAAGEGLRNFPDKAHNELLQVAATTGLVGLAAFLWLLIAIGALIKRGLAQRLDGEARVLLAALAAVALGFLAQAMFLFSVIDTGALSWLFVGLIVALAGGGAAPALHYRLPVWSRFALLAVAPLLAIWLGVLAVRPLVADFNARQGDIALQGVHRAGEEASAKAAAATEFYRAAIVWHPYDEQYQRRLATALRIQALAVTNERTRRRELLDEAVRTLNRAIALDPQMAGLYYERGHTYQAFGDDHRVDALNDFRRAVKLYPYYYAANRALADLAREMRRSDEGIIAGLTVLTLFPDDRETLLKLGDDYWLLGRSAEAIATWERLAASESKDAGLFLRLGGAYALKGDRDAARGTLERALAIDPKSEEAQRGLDALSKTGAISDGGAK